jgi:hypothetical protein
MDKEEKIRQLELENRIIERKLTNLRSDLARIKRATLWQRIKYFILGDAT